MMYALSTYYIDVGSLFGVSGVIRVLFKIMIYFLYLSLFLYGSIASIKKYEDQITLLFLWVVVPIVVSFALSYYRGPMTTVRNMIFILPMYLIVISRGITSISQSIIRLTDRLTSKPTLINQIENKQLIIGLILIMLFTSISIASIEQGYARQKQDWKGTADYLTTHVKEGELIVTFRESHLAFYYKGDAEIISLSKNLTRVNIVVNTASGNYTKIWFVSSPHSGVNKELLNWLNSNCRLEKKGSLGWEEHLELGAIYSYSIVKEYSVNNVSTQQGSI